MSAFSSAPPKHRPPPLQLGSLGPAFGSSFELANDDKTPIASSVREDSSFNLPSPWMLLDDFPLPPLNTPHSTTTIGVSKILRPGGNMVEVTTTPVKPRNRSQGWSGEQDENVPSTPKLARKRKHTKSFGSLGKGFRPAGPISVPNTPAPPPLPEHRSRSNSASTNEPTGSKGLTYSYKRDTFASRLFALASPKPDLDVAPLTRTISHYIPHHETRIASCPVASPKILDANPSLALSQSRSVSRPGHSKTKGRRTQVIGTSISPPTTPIDLGKPLVIPPRRTRSPSYIDLHVPPWRQTSMSPTQTSFVALGALISAPNTPASAVFDLPNEAMYLPSSESMDSLRLEVDPFGAGEPTSFFRFEFGRDEGGDADVSTSMTGFYEKVGFATQGGMSRRRVGKSSVRRNATPGIVPEIVVVSSSTALLVKRD
ncbi:hypothetical protein FRC06_009471 [Ceratobasidium sp. 370]|nr:hypothetical protein FRC06_009471 [Ceratobasidium sp. 370]